MDYSPEEYTKHYIIQALFKLMSENSFDKISIIDIAEKAGVGRATFYRHFKSKEDVIIYFFEHTKKDFISSQHYYPRCREDYFDVVKKVLTKFKEKKEPLKLLKRAHLEGIYLDYLNKNFCEMFSKEYPRSNQYETYIYSGMLFNISMAWLENDCKDDENELAELILSAIFDKSREKA